MTGFVLTAAGACLVLISLWATSLWYPIAAALLLLGGVGTFFSTAFGAYFSLPALISLSIGFLRFNIWNKGFGFLLVPLFFSWAATISSAVISRKQFRPQGVKYITASLILLACAFATDRAFTDKLRIHAREVQWSVGGDGPIPGREMANRERRVVLYFRQPHAVCYDALYSNVIASHLLTVNRPSVHVEYNTFYDFGRQRGYNIRSIEGIVLNQGERPVMKIEEGEGGIMESEGFTQSECNR